jgi:hypothetical protein
MAWTCRIDRVKKITQKFLLLEGNSIYAHPGFIDQNNEQISSRKKAEHFFCCCEPLPPKRQSTFRAVELLCTNYHVSFSSDE